MSTNTQRQPSGKEMGMLRRTKNAPQVDEKVTVALNPALMALSLHGNNFKKLKSSSGLSLKINRNCSFVLTFWFIRQRRLWLKNNFPRSHDFGVNS